MNTDHTGNGIEEQTLRRVVLVVPKQHVKTVKTALEQHGKLDQTTKISPEIDHQRIQAEAYSNGVSRRDIKEQDISNNQAHDASRNRMRIATTFTFHPSEETAEVHHKALALEITHELDISHLSDDISISQHKTQLNGPPTPPKNPLHKALHSALSKLPDTIFTNSDLTREALTSSFPDGYSVYPPLLLLPPNALTAPPWTTFLATHPPTSPTLQPLWSNLAAAMNVTHIAINSPIPLTQSSLTSANILRSPLNITPLTGYFGPTPTDETKQHPTQKDFDDALWVSTTQNGIHQVWAPLYTMFSRGNMREKTRVLHFPRPLSTVRAAMVDMYAGIGYFSFSYRATFRPVLCFELNPWSVEGLRRGAERNGWTYAIYSEDDVRERGDGGVDLDLGDGGVDFHVFRMSNTYARGLVSAHRSVFPPIRHVNLGLLPRSRDSWEDAVAVLDREMGGWIHAHENVGVGEMEERKEEVERIFQRYLGEEGAGRKATVEHVERVKMYAPGVVHCVFDVRVDGLHDTGRD
ncbi:S-adenosyl-L-methionine-dependent methyltransferase [Phaeosphaeria sp. MPI-PUGE-AT-0046c]|nr:S-adenosyl-L-methionine-dependent methyltransferase [Phaeosphaeria sp. MPI-PUGE-AT-0046c]